MERQILPSTLLCLLCAQILLVTGHGRLMDPPARNTMWRFGFNAPVDYHDNQLNCGGPEAQFGKNGGKCGICGDDYADIQGAHSVGGRYAMGIIGRQYKKGQVIQVEIELTANHWGRFEMSLCPVNDPSKEATESCFQRFPLKLADSKNEVPFFIPMNYMKWGIFQYNVTLPPSLTCKHCVLQWVYFTGLGFGTCPNGSVSVDCGGYATFRNCADIAILGGGQGGNSVKPKPNGYQSGPEIAPVQNTSSTMDFLDNLGYSGSVEYAFTSSLTNELNTTRPSSAIISANYSTAEDDEILQMENNFLYNTPPEVLPPPVRSQVCIGTPLFRKLFGADEWCKQNCLNVPPKCPSKMCTCPDTCDAVGPLKGVPGAETWCQGQCIVYPYKCHEEQESRCRCYKAVHEESIFTDFFPFSETRLGTW